MSQHAQELHCVVVYAAKLMSSCDIDAAHNPHFINVDSLNVLLQNAQRYEDRELDIWANFVQVCQNG